MQEKDYGLGHRGNLNLKRPNTKIEWTKEEVQEFIKCTNDPIYFIEKYMLVINSDDGMTPLKLWDYQKEMVLSMHHNRNTIIATSRRAGKSTAACAYILWFIIFNESKTVGLLANKGDTAREILSKVQLAYQNLPKWIQHGILDFNKGSLSLENHSRVLATSTTKDTLRGYNLDLILIDECVVGDTKITVRNKKTGLVEKIEIEELKKRLKRG